MSMCSNKALICSVAFISVLEAKVDFENDVLPLFQDYCMDCHGPDKQKSGFRTDRRVHLLKGGDSGLLAMVPGKPEESYLMEVIQSDDPEISMPPKGDRLFDDEIEILRDWIAEGAVWPGQMNEKVKEGTDHWAFQAIVRPELPGNTQNPIDAFINKRLEKEGIPKIRSMPLSTNDWKKKEFRKIKKPNHWR